MTEDAAGGPEQGEREEAGAEGSGKAVRSAISGMVSAVKSMNLGAAVAGAAGGTVARAATYTGFSQVTDAAKNVSFLIVILGLVQYIIRIYGGGFSSYTLIISLVLFILSGYALAERMGKDRVAILIPMLLFVVWYFVFQGGSDPQFLLYFGLIAAVVIFIPALFTKGASILPEAVGFLPALFLFLDLGLLPFLVDKLNLPLTPAYSGLILYMPWWAFFGMLTLPAEASKSGKVNLLINITKLAGILYIVTILVAPVIPNFGLQSGILPSPAQLEEVQAKLREQLPQTENPFISNILCIDQLPNVAECVKTRQEESGFKYTCTKLNELAEGTPAYEQCIKDEKEKKKNLASQVKGGVDTTIQIPTKAELTLDKNSFPQEYNPLIAYTADFKVENPRNQRMSVTFSCNFTGKSGVPDVEGKIQSPNSDELTQTVEFNERNFQSTLLCLPTTELKGGYTIYFTALMQGLDTKSRLQRAFIGTKTSEQKEKLRNTEINKAITISVSVAPAEFARINFELGYAKNEYIIENKPNRNIVLRANIENTGRGNVVSVRGYSFQVDKIPLEAAGFIVDNPACIRGVMLSLSGYTGYSGLARTIPLPPCLITDMPQELKEMSEDDWERKEFIADLQYDYQLTSKEDFIIPAVRS